MGEIPLKDHIDQRFRDLEARMIAAAETLAERLEGMNQFRRQIETERRDYLTRGEYEIAHRDLNRRVETLEQLVANYGGRLLLVAAMAVVAGALIAHLIKL